MEFLENRDPKLFIFTEKYQTETEEVVVHREQCTKGLEVSSKALHIPILQATFYYIPPLEGKFQRFLGIDM